VLSLAQKRAPLEVSHIHFNKERDFSHDLRLNSILGMLVMLSWTATNRGTVSLKQYHGDVPEREDVLATSTRQKFRTLTPRDLVGPLNDVERKYAPSEVFELLS
jgi:hypothetical protein